MLYPLSIYYYERHINPDGTTGVRWDYKRHLGKEQPLLTSTLKRCGTKIVYYGFDKRKNIMALWRTKTENDKGWLSKVHQPDIKNPRLGFGDLKPREDTALLFREDDKTDTLIIMVFEKQGNQSQVLFTQWLNGGIAEAISNNNVYLNTEIVLND